MGDGRELVNACRECDLAGGLYKRQGNGNAYVGDPEATWLCHNCGATFDSPKKRPPKPNSGGGRGNINVSEELLENVREATALEDQR